MQFFPRLGRERPLAGWKQRGLTLIELIVAITILVILTGAAIPIARVRIQREKERELRRALWESRERKCAFCGRSRWIR